MSEIEFSEEEGFREIKPGVEEATNEKKKKPFFSPLSCLLAAGLLVVVAAMIVPNFIRARSRGQLTSCKSNLKNIGTALEMYSTDWAGKYPGDMSLLTPNYLKTLPTCPSAGRMTYSYATGAVAYNATIGYDNYYIVCCSGSSHKTVSVPKDYPQYDGIRGLYER